MRKKEGEIGQFYLYNGTYQNIFWILSDMGAGALQKKWLCDRLRKTRNMGEKDGKYDFPHGK